MSGAVRFRFTIEKVYALPGRGVVVTGRVEEGSVTVGASIGFLGSQGTWISGVVSAIEVSQRLVDEAQTGQAASLLLEGIGKKHLQPGMILTEVPEMPMAASSREYEVETHYPAPMPIPASGKPIHPTSSFGRTALFLLIGILIALALWVLQQR